MPFPDEVVEQILLNAVHSAAVAASAWTGKGDAYAADEAATSAMRQQFAQAPFVVHVVIGEGERDNSPMLARGEKIYSSSSSAGLVEFDCAVDPCDGTSLVEKGLPGAIAIAVLSEAGGILGAPDFYMEKLVAPKETEGLLFLHQTPAERIHVLSKCLNKAPRELRIAVQDRPRHAKLIQELNAAGAVVYQFKEGDIVVGLQAALGDGPFDALMGIGAAPEGVILAAAVRCIGGTMQGRFAYDPDEVLSGLIGTSKQKNADRLRQAGILNPDKHFFASELVPASKRFVAMCGITQGAFVGGVAKNEFGELVSEAVLFSHRSNNIRKSVQTHKV